MLRFFIFTSTKNFKLGRGGGGGGLVVSMLTLCSDDLSSNPAKACSCFIKERNLTKRGQDWQMENLPYLNGPKVNVGILTLWHNITIQDSCLFNVYSENTRHRGNDQSMSGLQQCDQIWRYFGLWATF